MSGTHGAASVSSRSTRCQRARPDRVAQLLCLRPPHQTVDARVAELGPVQVVGVPGQERRAAEVLQPRPRVLVAEVPAVEPDLRAVSRVTDDTPVSVSDDRLHDHAVPERAQHLHGHLVEALCLRPRPDGDLHTARPRARHERLRLRQVGCRPRAARCRAGRVRAVGAVAGDVRRQELARRLGNVPPAPGARRRGAVDGEVDRPCRPGKRSSSTRTPSICMATRPARKTFSCGAPAIV